MHRAWCAVQRCGNWTLSQEIQKVSAKILNFKTKYNTKICGYETVKIRLIKQTGYRSKRLYMSCFLKVCIKTRYIDKSYLMKLHWQKESDTWKVAHD